MKYFHILRFDICFLQVGREEHRCIYFRCTDSQRARGIRGDASNTSLRCRLKDEEIKFFLHSAIQIVCRILDSDKTSLLLLFLGLNIHINICIKIGCKLSFASNVLLQMFRNVRCLERL